MWLVTLIRSYNNLPQLREELGMKSVCKFTGVLALCLASVFSRASEIERVGEGRHFYTSVKIPPGAETLYLSGAGASQNEDGTWDDMEGQAINVFNRFKTTLEEQGWSMSDIVQVRVFAVAGADGKLDFEGFNKGYRQFFGTEANPNKPVRSFIQIAGLVVDGWLIEVEIRAARMPK